MLICDDSDQWALRFIAVSVPNSQIQSFCSGSHHERAEQILESLSSDSSGKANAWMDAA